MSGPNAQAETQCVRALANVADRRRRIRRPRCALQGHIKGSAIARELRAEAGRERELANLAVAGDKRPCAVPRAKSKENYAIEKARTRCFQSHSGVPRIDCPRFLRAKTVHP